MYAIKEAIVAKEHSPEPLDTAIFFMDIRSYGKDFEKYYNRARDEFGVRFVRSRIHSLETATDDSHQVHIQYATEDGQMRGENFDLVVLSVGLQVDPGTVSLAKELGIDQEKLRPIESPELEELDLAEPGKDYTFTATVELRPEMTLSSYEPFEITIPSPEVTEEETKHEVDTARERFAKIFLGFTVIPLLGQQ